MSPHFSCRFWVPLLALSIAGSPVAASEAEKLLPAETDMILTINVRQFLEDHRNTDIVQRFLGPCRMAVKGDEKELRHYYQSRDLGKNAGITEQDFLSQARSLKSFVDSLGMEPLNDIDRVTCGFRRSDIGSWVIVIEGRFEEKKLRAAVRQSADQRFGSFKTARSGDVELWSVSGDADGATMALLNARTLAITSRKPEMDDLLARSTGAKKDVLAPRVRILMAKAEKEHVAVFLDHVDTLLKDVAKSWMDEV